MGGSFTAVGGVKQRGIALLSADGTRDGNFIASITGAGKVSAFALGPDGSILVGGDFTNLNGTAKSGLARLQPDGTVDSSFEAAVERPVSSSPLVSALSVQADGSILVGGAFSPSLTQMVASNRSLHCGWITRWCLSLRMRAAVL